MTMARANFTDVEVCLARIAAHDPAIHAMVHLDREAALQAAAVSARRWRAGAPLSPIDGLPIAIKANMAVKGWPWTAGIGAFNDRVAPKDADCITRLRAVGAVLIGLTNMDEGALGATGDNPWFGRTHNPLKPGFTAGGSSGGSAAAVAAGFCAAALGTDTIGSIRIPAAYCGIIGHKPQRGNVPVDGIVPLSPTLDTAGVLSKTTALCLAITDVLEGTRAKRATHRSGISYGVPDWSRDATVAPEIGAAFEEMLQRARCNGAELIPLPAEFFPFSRAQRLLLVIAEIEGAAVHREALLARPDGFSPEFSAMLAWGANAGADRSVTAKQELKAIAKNACKALAGIDGILLPTTPQTAFAFGSEMPRDQAVFTALASCLGAPATAFPIGQTRGGLPVSAQVITRSSSLCLTAAEALTTQCGSSPPDTFIDSAVI